MFNQIKNILIVAALFVFFGAQAQPIVAPTSVPTTTIPFNGFTSEITVYDGDPIQCFIPVGTGLNGIIAGIDDKLCEIQDLLDSVLAVSNVNEINITAISNTLTTITNQLNEIQNITLVSPDGTVDISLIEIDSTVWELAVNIALVEELLLADIDLQCLTVTDTTVTSIIEEILGIVCETPAQATVCSNVYNFAAQVSDVGDGTIDLQLTPTIGGVFNPLECVTSVEYLVEVKNNGGNVIHSEILISDVIMDVPTTYSLPVGYSTGAREIDVTLTVESESCSLKDATVCTPQQVTNTYQVVEGQLAVEFLVVDDYVYIDASVPIFNPCVTIYLLDNDIIENATVTSVTLLSSPSYGTVTQHPAIQERVRYCIPENPPVLGTYTFDYMVTLSNGDTGTGTVTINITSGAARVSPTNRVDASSCVSFGYAGTPYNETSLTVSGTLIVPSTQPLDTGYVVLTNSIIGVDTVFFNTKSWYQTYDSSALFTSSGDIVLDYHIVLSDSTIFDYTTTIPSVAGIDGEYVGTCIYDENICNTNWETTGLGVCLGYSPQEGGSPFTWEVNVPPTYTNRAGIITLTYIEECNGTPSFTYTDTIIGMSGLVSANNGTVVGNIFDGVLTHTQWVAATDSCGGADTSEVATMIFNLDLSATNSCGETVRYQEIKSLTVGLAGTLPDPQEDCYDAP